MTWALFRAGALLWLLFVPTVVLAVSGDPCETSGAGQQFASVARGTVKPVWCIKLIDDINSPSGGPTTYSLGQSNTVGYPDMIAFLVGQDNDCTAGSITFTSSEWVGGRENNIASPNPTLDLSGAGTTRINVPLHDFPIGSVINARWTAVGGCTGGFDILMVGYEITR